MAFVIELLLIGVGLSMDAFAVAVCKGLAMRKVNKKQAVVIGLFFGGFQALMPFIGWALGTQFESYITSIDRIHLTGIHRWQNGGRRIQTGRR